MPVIALAAFIVVADQTTILVTVEQGVFQPVCRSDHRFGHFPQDHLSDHPVIENPLAVLYQPRTLYNNFRDRWQEVSHGSPLSWHAVAECQGLCHVQALDHRGTGEVGDGAGNTQNTGVATR